MIKLAVCRLCLNPNNLIDVFYRETSCAGMNHLRTCILLCTGTNILFEDTIPKYVCKPCCDLSLRLFQFRKQARANETALKKYEQIPISINSNYPVDIIQISDVNRLLFKNPNIEVRLSNSLNKNKSIQSPNKDYAVHPSVSNLVKIYKNIILPNKVLKDDLNPVVTLDTDWSYQYSYVDSDSSSENKSDSEDTSAILLDTTTSVLRNNKTRINNVNDLDESSARKRKKSLRTIPQQPIKRSKSIPVLTKFDDLSQSLHHIIKSRAVLHNSKENVFTYNMFFHSSEFNYIKNIYANYSKKDKNYHTKSVNTNSITNVLVIKKDKYVVLENLLWQLSIFHIPIEYSYEENFKVHVFENQKKDVDFDSQDTDFKHMWSKSNIIDLNRS